MQQGVDPLALLRNAIGGDISKAIEFKIDEKNVTIGNQKLPRKMRTAYRSKRGKGEFYTVEALVYFLQVGKQSYAKYIKQCHTKKIMTVKTIDQKVLREYLLGKIENSDYIDVMALVAAHPTSVRSEVTTARESGIKEGGKLPAGKAILMKERPLVDRFSQLNHPTVRFTNVVKMFEKILQDSNKKRKLATERNAKSSKKRKDPSRKDGGSKRRRQMVEVRKVWKDSTGTRRKLPSEKFVKDPFAPIIIVPKAPASLLTMYNIKQFLQHKAFVPSIDVKKASDKKPRQVKVERVSAHNPEKTVRFYVVDEARKLNKQDWEQVVAIFATGASWQFADYPFKSPAEIFERTCGFHIHLSDDELKSNIHKWKVHKLAISKQQRYQDMPTVYKFWDLLMKFMQARYSHLHF